MSSHVPGWGQAPSKSLLMLQHLLSEGPSIDSRLFHEQKEPNSPGQLPRRGHGGKGAPKALGEAVVTESHVKGSSI